MAKFNFRLTSLLRLRERERDRCRAQLAEAYQAEQILQRSVEQLLDELTQIKSDMRCATQAGRIDVDTLLVSHRYELLLRAQQRQLESQAEQLTDEIQRRRTLLVEADKQVRVLEKLRERQHKVHLQQERKREVAEMDEFAARSAKRPLP